MHIVLIHQAFAALDEPGGTRHHEFAHYLSAHGHTLTIIASPVSYLTGDASRTSSTFTTNSNLGNQKGTDHLDNINIIRSYTYSALHRSFLHRLISFFSFMLSSFYHGLKVRNVDLVWGTSPPIFQGITAWALARLKKVPFLFEVRDLWPAFAVAVGVLNNIFLIRASEWLERFLYRRADRIIVNSPGFINHVKERAAGEVILIPNGADPRMFNPTSRGVQFRRSHGLEDKFVVLYAGAHGMSNDLTVLLDAANHLKQYSAIVVVLLGAGKDKKALQKKANLMNLDNVRFLPPISKTMIPEALASSDVCVAILKPIELYKTVYPNKVFDYMAAGRPVILAIDGVIREVVESAKAGYYVPPGEPATLAEAIHKVYSDPELRIEMGNKGRELVESRFDRADLAEKLSRTIEELFEAKAE
ncbi:MAG: glycosyltransferase family 4 protein [Anaerolineales bacterium]|jgi:glycosyltransferase involved in cell wall biosynthesis